MQLEELPSGAYLVAFNSTRDRYQHEIKPLTEPGAKNWTVRRLDHKEVSKVLALRNQIQYIRITPKDAGVEGTEPQFVRRLVPDGISDITSVMLPEDRVASYRVFGFTWMA